MNYLREPLFVIALRLSNNVDLNPNSFNSASFSGMKGLTMAHLNIRSLVKNIEELRQVVRTNNPGSIREL